MKRYYLLLALFFVGMQSASAFTEQYKVFDSGKHTKTCRTSVINISNQREPNFCTYVFTPYIEGKKEGTLLFEFLLNPNNEKSVEIKNKVIAVLKDLKEHASARPMITLTMSDGEEIYFDASAIKDWSSKEWNQLLIVAYDKATNEWRTQIMFPLEQMMSNSRDLPDTSKKRHKYILEKLQNFSIEKLTVSDVHREAVIQLDVPVERPTDGTFSSMVGKCK